MKTKIFADKAFELSIKVKSLFYIYFIKYLIIFLRFTYGSYFPSLSSKSLY